MSLLTALPMRSQFGLLVVEGTAPPAPDGRQRVTCRCRCGRLAVRAVTELREGRAAACLRCQAKSAPVEEEPQSVIRPPQPDESSTLEWLHALQSEPAAMARLLTDLDRAVVSYLAERWGGGHASIESQRREARAAALRRLRFMTADDIARRLGGEGPPDRSLVHQWVCRGRRVVLSALEHWSRRTRSELVRRRIDHIRPLMAAGRRDAGRPRPWARKPENEVTND